MAAVQPGALALGLDVTNKQTNVEAFLTRNDSPQLGQGHLIFETTLSQSDAQTHGGSPLDE
jgi:hypothetical protein